jgi:DNA protecting protein DprA
LSYDATEIAVRLALMQAEGVGPATLRQLRAAAHALGCSLSALAGRAASELIRLLPPGFEGLAVPLAACRPAHVAGARALLGGLQAQGGWVAPSDAPGYPPGLEVLPPTQRPDLLFGFGAPALLHAPAASIAGTRTPSPSSARFACAAAASLARGGFTVVSGGAAGVDTTAHDACLDAGGRTVVVLPCGLLRYRMPAAWAQAVAEGRAAIVSQFAPHAAWSAGAAVTRNATISALGRLTLVVEPHKTGGSVRTARAALEQGRPLYFHGASRGVAATLQRAGGRALSAPHGLAELVPAEPPAAPAQGELF